MRKPILFLILCFTLGCATSTDVGLHSESNSTNDIDERSTQIILTFRDSDLSPFIEKAEEMYGYPRSHLAWQPGFVVGAVKRAPTRSIEVLIFKSPKSALKAVKRRNKDFSSVGYKIVRDDQNRPVMRYIDTVVEYHEGSEQKNGLESWWYTDSPSAISLKTASLCVVKGNVVVSLFDNTHTFEQIEPSFWDCVTQFFESIEVSGAGPSQHSENILESYNDVFRS